MLQEQLVAPSEVFMCESWGVKNMISVEWCVMCMEGKQKLLSDVVYQMTIKNVFIYSSNVYTCTYIIYKIIVYIHGVHAYIMKQLEFY